MVYHCHVMNYEIEADTPEKAAETMRELLQGGWPMVTVTTEEQPMPFEAIDVDTEAYFHPYEGN